ncbi:MAG: L-2-hydroxyglutarate oxidase [Arachnia sp.]
MPTADVVVVGAGIVGLAVARQVLIDRPRARVVVVDKAGEVAAGQTGHNSGVIHAGLYYAPGSLKARLCRAGEAATKAYCCERGVRYDEIGKLVVATDDSQRERLSGLRERGLANGIDVAEIDTPELRRLEPAVRGVAALLSPKTGIVDYREVCRALAEDVSQRGGTIALGQVVTGIRETAAEVCTTTSQHTFLAGQLIACAGLQADRIARAGGVSTATRIVPFRGEYYALPPHLGGVVSRLIYPVPDPTLPFLGVHVSPMIGGSVIVGPNAVLGLAREGYPKGSVNLRDLADIVGYPGLWHLARRNLLTGATEVLDSLIKRRYLHRVQRYLPQLRTADLRPHPAGIRAQALRPDGTLVEDFDIAQTARQLHILNAPSPAATSALPIAREVTSRLG